MRRSRAPLQAKVINNLPGLYPVEDWRAYYWTVTPQGDLEERWVTIQLPQGLAEVCSVVRIGQEGCVYRVRRWGLACRPSLLEYLDLDVTSLLTHDRARFPGGDDQELVYLVTQITHFDLPGYFIIASEEHPLLLFDPVGDLKGSYTRWHTYLGALAWLVSGGRVNTRGHLLWTEERALYYEALQYLREMMKGATHS